MIQGAQHLLHNLTFLERWPDADRRSKIVFITQGFDRAEVEDMIGLLDRVATRTAAARARAQAQTAGQRIARDAPWAIRGTGSGTSPCRTAGGFVWLDPARG